MACDVSQKAVIHLRSLGQSSTETHSLEATVATWYHRQSDKLRLANEHGYQVSLMVYRACHLGELFDMCPDEKLQSQLLTRRGVITIAQIWSNIAIDDTETFASDASNDCPEIAQVVIAFTDHSCICQAAFHLVPLSNDVLLRDCYRSTTAHTRSGGMKSGLKTGWST